MLEKPFLIFSDLDIRTAEALIALEKLEGVKIVDTPPKKDEHELLLPTLLGMAAGSLHPKMMDDMLGYGYSPKPEKTEQDLINDENKKRKAQEKRNRKALQRIHNKR